MVTITARIPDLLDDDLDKLSHFQDRSKSNVIKRAIEKYVIEMMEDIEDVIDAERILGKNNKSYPLEEVMKELNIEPLEKKNDNLANKTGWKC